MSDSSCPISLEPIPSGHEITLSGTTFDVESLLGLILVNGNQATHPHTRKPFTEDETRSIYSTAVINERTRSMMHDKNIRTFSDLLHHMGSSGSVRAQEDWLGSLGQAYGTRWSAIIDAACTPGNRIDPADISEVVRVYNIIHNGNTREAINDMVQIVERRIDEIIQSGMLVDESSWDVVQRLQSLVRLLHNISAQISMGMDVVPQTHPVISAILAGNQWEPITQILLRSIVSRLRQTAAGADEGADEGGAGAGIGVVAEAEGAAEVGGLRETAAGPRELRETAAGPSEPRETAAGPAAMGLTVPVLVNHFLVDWREFLGSLGASESPIREVDILDEVISSSATLVTALRLVNDISDASPPVRNAEVLRLVLSKMLSACRETLPLTLRRLRVEACLYKVLERYLLHIVLDTATLHRLGSNSHSAQSLSDSPIQNAIVRATELSEWNTAQMLLDCLRILDTPSYEPCRQYLARTHTTPS